MDGSTYTCIQVSAPSLLLPQNNALVLRRAPKRANPDQTTALSLARDGGFNLDVYADFLGSTWRKDQVLSYGAYSDNLSIFTISK